MPDIKNYLNAVANRQLSERATIISEQGTTEQGEYRSYAFNTSGTVPDSKGEFWLQNTNNFASTIFTRENFATVITTANQVDDLTLYFFPTDLEDKTFATLGISTDSAKPDTVYMWFEAPAAAVDTAPNWSYSVPSYTRSSGGTPVLEFTAVATKNTGDRLTTWSAETGSLWVSKDPQINVADDEVEGPPDGTQIWVESVDSALSVDINPIRDREESTERVELLTRYRETLTDETDLFWRGDIYEIRQIREIGRKKWLSLDIELKTINPTG